MSDKQIIKNAKALLKNYKQNDDLTEFDIIHMYPTRQTRDEGYINQMFFNAVMFNTSKMETRTIEDRDGLDLDKAVVKSVHIFADGSTMVHLNGIHHINGVFQSIPIYKK